MKRFFSLLSLVLAHGLPRSMARPVSGVGVVGAMVLGGCSLISPVPSIELAKGVGVAVSSAVSHGEGLAVDTVHHGQPVGTSVCIELNGDATVADIVPALQMALREHRVDSRVYDGPPPPGVCSVRLGYATAIEWDTPPFQSGLRSYMSAAHLVLRAEDGRVLSSSRYAVGAFGLSKWSSTRRKIGPVVQALLTGFER